MRFPFSLSFRSALTCACPQTSSVYILLQTAECLRMADELREAAEVYEAG